MVKQKLHVGLSGAGIGGLATAIALRIAGAKVTVLEAASELGEIGAGIQMTPNVSRLLIKWGVANIIGSDLVEIEELDMRKRDGTQVGHTTMIPDMRRDLGFPWWVVHRAHLHAALVKVAVKRGATLLTSSRVVSIDQSSPDKKVAVLTSADREHTFDLLIGSDGINSVVRKTLFPSIFPKPPTANCAYRAIVPYSLIEADPIARELITHGKMKMDVWMGHGNYIITYPISGGRDFNLVLSHHLDRLVDKVEDVTIEEMRETYKDYDPRIQRVVEMITEVQRWPLLVTGPLECWSNAQNNIVLMGDAAHSMTNHMAQGAATAIEDGAFLARCIAHVVQGDLTLAGAIAVYENGRMPKARLKQQVSFLNGQIWQLPEGESSQMRDEKMRLEMVGRIRRSPNLYGDPRAVWEFYGYDAERHADLCLGGGLEGEMEVAERYLDWFLPDGEVGREIGERIRSKL